jgi:hypothetical protein
VDPENPIYVSVGNCLIDRTTKTLTVGCNVSEIPADGSIARIEQYAFFGCTTMTSLSVPSGVGYIGENAFEGCSSLTTVTLPSSVYAMGQLVFEDCKSLAKIVYEGTFSQWARIEKGGAYLAETPSYLVLECASGVFSREDM